jgi:putative aminopeptidase FrvX
MQYHRLAQGCGAGVGPNRYIQSPNELVALEDLERTARLLATLVRRVEDGMDFIL